ncbi:MAG TPA: hypothetical protein VGP36_22180 [Mycobacteriales bacterium]|jgi:hypothetical protein|nr:hypothetical protein [Mycobacteriales bacterium]
MIAERELPAAAHAAARGRVVAAVTAPPARRWIPAAAAAAVVVAVALPVALLGRPDGPPAAGTPTAASATRRPPFPPDYRPGQPEVFPPEHIHSAAPWTPAPNPAHTLPAEATIADRCLNGTGTDFAAGTSLRALSTDDRGYVAFVGAKDKILYCAFAWDGSVDHRSAQTEGAIAAPGEYAPAGTPSGLGGLDGMVDGDTSRLPGSDPTLYSALYYGVVTRNVRSVTFTMNGAPPATADIRDGSFVVRVVFHGPSDEKALRQTGRLVAYDAAGKKIGALSING